MRSRTHHRSTARSSDGARVAREQTQERINTARALAQELQQSQSELEKAHRRQPSLADFGAADLSPVPLALLSRGGTVTAAGTSLFMLFEAQPGQVCYRPLSEFLDPRDHSDFFRFLGRAAASTQTHRAQFRMAVPGKRPKDILLVLSPIQLAGEKQTIFRAAFIDLDASDVRDFGPRAAAHDTRLMEAIDGIVWEAQFPVRFTFVSPQVERILGFAPKQWLNDPAFWEKHIHHDDRDRVLQARADAARKPAAHVLEYRMITADRKTVWVKDSAMILAGTPEWTRMCGIITDITDLQEAREELKHVNQHLAAAVAERTARMEQSLEAMETLCYGIAHDLKAPLRGLQGFIGILMSDYDKVFDDDAKLYAQRCQLALRRMGDLIEAVLTYGRLNHTVPELIPIRLKPLLDRILQSIEPDTTAKDARVDVQMSLPTVMANPFLLEQVFTNLIGNALKFNKPGSRPEISISAIQTEPSNRPLTSDLRPPTPVVRITVTDNGIGIAPEFVKRMFGMFQKLHRGDEYPGTGIGLSIVKRAVELMNGRVGIFSEPDQGSSFWIELPAASPI